MPKLRIVLVSLAATMGATAATMPQAVGGVGPPGLVLQGDITPVHDPAIIKHGDTYYVFTTSQAHEKKGLIHVRSSRDLISWARAGSVFP